MGLFQLWKMRVNETLQQRLLADIGVALRSEESQG
jgi:hypothetical protein